MATTTATAALSMKLLIDSKAQRLLFAEASKEVVDFLFSLLALPVATVVKLVGKEAMVGCVGNLYASVDKLDYTYVPTASVDKLDYTYVPTASVDELDYTYVQTAAARDALLRRTVLSPAATTNSSLLRLPPAPSNLKSYFKCNSGYGCNYMTDAIGTACPGCSNPMKTTTTYVAPSSGQQAAQNASTCGAKGFVQGITYTVLDDLTVTHMSTISGITLLNTFAVKDLGDLKETTVQLGYNEALAILKASLQSNTVLTDVFLHGQAKAASSASTGSRS